MSYSLSRVMALMAQRKLLGEFKGDDRIIVWTSKNQYYITGYDLGQHFPRRDRAREPL